MGKGFLLKIDLSMIDDDNYLSRIMIIMSEGELRPTNQVIPSMRRGSTSTMSKGSSWKTKGKLGKGSDNVNSAEESSDKTPLTVRHVNFLFLWTTMNCIFTR